MPKEQVNIKFDKSKIKFASPIKQLIPALKKDSSYRYSWQANIAMAYLDSMQWYKDSTGKKYLNKRDFHKIANDAAIYFLQLLCDEFKYPKGR